MLETYTERCMGEIVKTLSDRAQEAQAQHTSEVEGDSSRSGSEAGYSGRGIGPEVTL